MPTKLYYNPDRPISKLRVIYANKLRSTPTNTETRFINFLKLNKIKFEFQRLIKRYIVDFYLPDYNAVIEIDGEQHQDKYAKRKDLLRDSWFWRYGFKVVRFTNKEAISPELVKDRLRIALECTILPGS